MDDATALSERIARRELSCVELMRACLERIERCNPALNAIVSLREPTSCSPRRRSATPSWPAASAAAGCTGSRTRSRTSRRRPGSSRPRGSPLYADFVPEADSEVARRIRGAGAIVIGKTNVPEFGYGSQTYNDVFGPTRNPYDAARTAGGSSGGAAAALAAGLVPVADGSDYMGSLRNPAAFCNVYGFRPSLGRVGSPPPESAFEAPIGTAGPMARSPRDLAALLATLAGPHPELPFSIDEDPAGLAAPLEPPDPARLRIGWLGDLGGHLPFEPGILELCEAALARARRRGRPGGPRLRSRRGVGGRRHAAPLRRHLGARAARASASSRSCAGRPRARSRSPARRCTPRSGRGPSVAAALRALLRDHDALALPSAQVFPFDVETHWPREIAGRPMPTYHRWMEVVIHASLAGLPVAGVPAGFGPTGLPMGMQLIGRPRGDRALLELTEAYDRATG